MCEVWEAVDPPTGMKAQQRKCDAHYLFGNATKEGKEVEGREPGTGTGPWFCPLVPHGQEGSLTSCMQWQGLRAEARRGHSACQLLCQVPGPRRARRSGL